MKIFNYKNKSGFTLVETLIALSIFSISVVGLMVVLGKGISDANFAKYKNTASYLAEEGVEYIRNMRDTYVLYDSNPSDGWTQFLAKFAQCTTTNGCKYDDSLTSYDLNSLKSMNVNQCNGNVCSLYYDTSTGRYGWTASATSSFYTRVITMKAVDGSPDEIQIKCTVTWSTNGSPHSVVFADNLFAWRGQ